MASARASACKDAVLSTLLDSEHYKSLVKDFTCKGCKKYMRPPIHLCLDGHSMCSACFKSNYKCHECQKELSAIKSVQLELVINKILFPCTNDGCPRHATLTRLDSHSLHCQYRIIDCFMSRVYGGCEWHGRAGDWLEHCIEAHRGNVTDLPFVAIEDKWDSKRADPVVNYHLLRCYDYVFHLYQIYDKKRGRMMWTVLLNNDEAEKYFYEIELFDPSDAIKRIIYRRHCKSDKEADFLEQAQNIYVPVETVFTMLDSREVLNYKVRIGLVDNCSEFNGSHFESRRPSDMSSGDAIIVDSDLKNLKLT